MAMIGDDILDLRDLQERRDELDGIVAMGEELDEDESHELAILVELFDDDGADPDNDPTLIHDRYFKEYAQELADDIGAIPREYSWPTSCIDWEQAARELQMDYSVYTIDGHDYWTHS